MTQSMPAKLRLIADCIEQGKTVQVRYEGEWSAAFNAPMESGDVHVTDELEYREKPKKPRVTSIPTWCREPYSYDAVELTEEVRKALSDAGIEI